MTNEIVQTKEFRLQDFIRFVLPQELRKRKDGRDIVVISDFDETLCSRYMFSDKWKTHVPLIRTDLRREAQALSLPMCIATARGAIENVSWLVWHQLSRIPMPLVAENGAVLVWPSAKVNQQPEVEILASYQQLSLIRQIQTDLERGLIHEFYLFNQHEIILRKGRLATVELRGEDTRTRVGAPDDYPFITNKLVEFFPEAISQIDIISTGSSLGIQPKGVNKKTGIHTALDRSGINLEKVFMLGLGDNKNDESLFNFVRNHGGLTIGVRSRAQGLCDFMIDGGDEVSWNILKIINELK